MELLQDYTSDDDGKDDPSAVGPLGGSDEQSRSIDDHQGRLRSFPHQEGNYATHVYVSGATLDPCCCSWILPVHVKLFGWSSGIQMA